MNILVTGANGFVGKALVLALLRKRGVKVSATARQIFKLPEECEFHIASLDLDNNWTNALRDCDTVVHVAARVHILRDRHTETLSTFSTVNTGGTLHLARQAVKAGVKRFVFVSSIKVNGEATKSDAFFTADDIPKPTDEYGVSKWEAEQGLMQLAADTKMEVVIIRPPMLYGPNVKGNFAKLATLIAKGIPLPLAMVKNQRSFMALDNLVDLILTCIDHPKAANQIFLASDAQDLSTPELLNRMANAMRRNIILFPFPLPLLNLSATIIGKKNEANSLLGSLRLDISKTRDVLDWSPVIDVEEGLRRCFVKKRQS